MRRTRTVQITVNDKEKRAIEHRAAAYGLTVAEYLRTAAINQLPEIENNG